MTDKSDDMETTELETVIAELIFDGWSDAQIVEETQRLVEEIRAELKAKLSSKAF